MGSSVTPPTQTQKNIYKERLRTDPNNDVFIMLLAQKIEY